MARRHPLPDWLQELIGEIFKPPYFLQALQGNSDVHRSAETSTNSTVSRMSEADRPRQCKHSAGRDTAPPAGTNASRAHRSPKHERTPHPAAVRDIRYAAAARAGTRDAGGPRGSDAASAEPATESERRWRAVLTQAGLPPAIVSNYGWKVENAARVMNIVKVTTPKGVFALKKTHIAPERVQFLHEAQLYARDHGFTRMAQFVLTRLGKPYVRRQGETYYATEWLTGNPVNFASTAQVGQLAHALAQFHEATRGLETTGYHPPMEFALEQMLRRRANDLRTLLAEAQRRAQPDEFDSVLLRLAPALREDAERSLKLVDDPQCRAFLERDEDTPGLCHLDVIPGNFVYDAEKRVHLLDLDLATYAPRVLDLAHLLRRSLQVVNWSSEAAYACFLHYNAVRPLTAEEYVLVQALLTFPYRAWRLAASRYRTLRDAAQVEELKDYAQQEERRQAFLNAFAKQVTRRTPN